LGRVDDIDHRPYHLVAETIRGRLGSRCHNPTSPSIDDDPDPNGQDRPPSGDDRPSLDSRVTKVLNRTDCQMAMTDRRATKVLNRTDR
jgi:hypothetical protein